MRVAEERYKKGWRIVYRKAGSTEESRASGLFLKSDQYKPGKFAKEHGSLGALAQTVLKETRTSDNNLKLQFATSSLELTDLRKISNRRGGSKVAMIPTHGRAGFTRGGS